MWNYLSLEMIQFWLDPSPLTWRIHFHSSKGVQQYGKALQEEQHVHSSCLENELVKEHITE